MNYRNTSKNQPPKIVHSFDFVMLLPLTDYLNVQGQYGTFEPQFRSLLCKAKMLSKVQLEQAMGCNAFSCVRWRIALTKGAYRFVYQLWIVDSVGSWSGELHSDHLSRLLYSKINGDFKTRCSYKPLKHHLYGVEANFASFLFVVLTSFSFFIIRIYICCQVVHPSCYCRIYGPVQRKEIY